MTNHPNHMSVHASCYGTQTTDSELTELTLEEKISARVYPALGIVSIAYQLYLLFFG